MEKKARMRTIPKAVEELKAKDPDCYFSAAILRRMVKRGEVPAVIVGSRPLINMDVLYQVLYSER